MSGGGGGGGGGAEIGYTQITANVNIVGTTEGTATTVISPGALTFTGQPVLVQFCTNGLRPPSTVSQSANVGLFESGTLVLKMGNETCWAAGVQIVTPVYYQGRFTPSAGSHTYLVAAWADSTTGTPLVAAGLGGAGNTSPASVRFAYA